MRRTVMISTILVGIVLVFSAAAAQQPIATEDAAAQPAATVTLDPFLLTLTAPAGQTVATPEVVAPAAQVTAEAVPASSLGDALGIVQRLLNDLNVLANAQLGAERPVGWNDSQDTNDPQLPLLLRLNLEFMAERLLGAARPTGWFGAVASTPFAIARDIRHDLELLADSVVAPGVRPNGWVGDDPLMRCPRATQALVSLLERGGVFALPPALNPNDPTYCQQVEIAASQFAEVNLLNSPSASVGAVNAASSGPATITSDFAVAFLDRGASLPLGTIPLGTSVTPVARSYAEFSRMMLVRGENFEVFVEYTNTSLTEEAFLALPDVNGVPNEPFCGAEWCTDVG